MLLRQVGVETPSDADITAAIEAHDRLIEAVEAIALRSQSLMAGFLSSLFAFSLKVASAGKT
jgi:hypothetical protein